MRPRSFPASLAKLALRFGRVFPRPLTHWPRGRLPYAAYATALIVPSAFFLLAYPALFPTDVREPVVETDPAEGKVWLDSRIVLELRGSYTLDDVLQHLQVDPPVTLEPEHVTVEQLAPLPWHKPLPWAVTRVTINNGREPLFQQGTEYTLAVSGEQVAFETITVPEVTHSLVEGDQYNDRQDVPTNSRVVLYFNEEVEWTDEYLAVTPPVDIETQVSVDDHGRTVVAISPATRYQNATQYEVTLLPGIRDVHDHAGAAAHTTSFRTWAQPTVVAATPEGVTQPIDQPITVTFERPVDRASAQASFTVTPPIAGAFEWQDDKVVRFRPAAPLPYSSSYTVQVAPIAFGGDPFVPRQWAFRTQDPPINLDLVGRLTAPTYLEGKASGGLGQFTYAWSNGGTGTTSLINVPHGQVLPVELRVTSGDQVAVRTVEVSGPPYPSAYVAVECPAGWGTVGVGVCYQKGEGPAGTDIHITRIDMRDPELEVTSALAADHLGAARTVAEAALGRGAVAATNGDFFHQAPPGVTPVGPVIDDGSIVRLDRRFNAAFIMGRNGAAWAGGPTETRLQLHGAGGVADVWNVNTLPNDGEVAIFNSHWGPVLDAGFDGCYATYIQDAASLTGARDFICGPVMGIPLRAGEVVLVARGAATHWLNASLPAPIEIGDPVGLTTFRMLVGGSHALIQSGVPAPLGYADSTAAPRTAIAVDASGFLYLVVADGRRGDSPGLSIAGLQAHLVAMGMVEAVNLDGGGSSEMVVGGMIRNRPSDGKERAVPGIVQVTYPRPDCWQSLVRC